MTVEPTCDRLSPRRPGNLQGSAGRDPGERDPETARNWRERRRGYFMPEQARTGGGRFQAGIVADTHVHTMDYLPRFASLVFRWAIRRTVPPPFFLDQLPLAGVDAVVANAVGDRVATAWWGRPPWRAIHKQLCRIRREAEGAHIELAMSAAQVWRAYESGYVSVILGLEGGDGIGRDLSRLDKLHEWGVRLLVPVHLRDNHIGTTRLPWQSYMRIPGIPRRRPRGLTEFGHAVIERMNSLGMIIDVSHSDTTTALDIAKRTRQPIVASHAGARRIEDFERFLDDGEIIAIAETGGLVGLWPYHYGGDGPRDLDALMRHARYIADLVGTAHLCIGTDLNGVPGTLTGFRRENDVRLIAEHLKSAGFAEDDLTGILGGNFMRVFERVAPR
jgi:microsomal dipeptidase-like Zn-dependent dipeptidase